MLSSLRSQERERERGRWPDSGAMFCSPRLARPRTRVFRIAKTRQTPGRETRRVATRAIAWRKGKICLLLPSGLIPQCVVTCQDSHSRRRNRLLSVHRRYTLERPQLLPLICHSFVRRNRQISSRPPASSMIQFHGPLASDQGFHTHTHTQRHTHTHTSLYALLQQSDFRSRVKQ